MDWNDTSGNVWEGVSTLRHADPAADVHTGGLRICTSSKARPDSSVLSLTLHMTVRSPDLGSAAGVMITVSDVMPPSVLSLLSCTPDAAAYASG
jgi:hypothetical protein